MTKRAIAAISFVSMMFFGEFHLVAQSLSGTSLVVSGTATIETLEVLNVADIQGNFLFLGTSGTNPALSITYHEGLGGADATLEFLAANPSTTWNWQRLTTSGSTVDVMTLDASNRLILSGTATSNPPQIILDPNGTLSVNGSAILTQQAADGLYIPADSGLYLSNGKVGIGTDSPQYQFQIGEGYNSAIFTNDFEGSGKGFFGILEPANNLYYGIITSLPVETGGAAAIGGYYQGLGIGGASADTGAPIFGVLNRQQFGTWGAFTIYDDNVVHTYNNYLDDGDGGASFVAVTVDTTLDVTGDATFFGKVHIEPRGDILMGEFGGPTPLARRSFEKTSSDSNPPVLSGSSGY